MPSPTAVEGGLFAAASWRALGTYVQLVVQDGEALAAARAMAESVLDGVDRTCSRFRADSDLVRANAAAGTWVRVDPLLVQAVTAALEAARVTGGLVDPTLGAELVALGYDVDLAQVRARDGAEAGRGPATDPAALPRAPRTAGWRDVELDPAGAVKVPAGLALDLGATAKAWAADLVADAVAEGTGTQLIVSLGGDDAAGLPADTDDEDAVAWQIDVAERPEEPAQERVSLVAAGLATSSTQARRWRRAGRIVHHLIDPRTGGPVPETFRTVTVVAPTALAANTASTAALVLGEGAPQWLSDAGLGARLVAADGAVTWTKGWPA